MSEISDRCPACGHATLFVGAAGWITCSFKGCPEPGLTDALTRREGRWRLAGEASTELEHATQTRQSAVHPASRADGAEFSAQPDRAAGAQHPTARPAQPRSTKEGT
jgi:hypothetical protein